MTTEQLTVLFVKGAISELTAAQRESCDEVADHIRRVIKQAGEPGLLALALVGAEEQEKVSRNEKVPATGGDAIPVTEAQLDEYGYPKNWPKCPSCGRPSLDGHKTCGRFECGGM